jgi:hypothetical protein
MYDSNFGMHWLDTRQRAKFAPSLTTTVENPRLLSRKQQQHTLVVLMCRERFILSLTCLGLRPLALQAEATPKPAMGTLYAARREAAR